ncbi:protein serine/threonine kinase [Pelomyxa schiedti]|nr:protein serine/threonine kinase [Pelomyxa schiedti]
MNIGGCFISSICYNAGEENSESPCHQVCNPNVSTLLWTPLNCPDISEGSTSNDDDVVWIILILCVLSVLILVSLASFALLYLRKQKNENQIAEDTRLLQSCSVNGPTFPVHRRNSQPDIFSRTPGDRRTSMALFPLEVIPKGNLTFGCGGIQAPVGKEITQSITLCNNGKWGVRFAVLAPPHDQNKFQTFFSRQSGFLRPKTHVVIDVKMTIFCTTVVDVQIQIIAQRDQSIRQERLFLPVLVETKLSTVLDYDELTIGTEIGEGTYGVVFVGFWRGQEVAIKILKEQVGTKTADMFSKEVSVLETIRCPQIVNFLGAVHTPGKLCMVFEYLKLGSVRECMKSHPFSLGLKLKCLLDCSRGMNFLHQSNLTHRDIKPDNLLMFSLDITASVNCKITDFGSTRAINLDRSTQQYTTKIGTPVYMAPELLQQGKYKQSADVYSYGILSWEIITESSAFSDLPTVWRITKHVVAGNVSFLYCIVAKL